MMNNKQRNISPEKFKLVHQDSKISDVKFDTKPIGYFKDAFIRFKKNKSSVAAAIIIVVLLLFAIFAPMISKYETTTIDAYYNKALPKSELFCSLGWDGTRIEKDRSQRAYDRLMGIGLEKNSNAKNKNYTAVKKVVSSKEITTIEKGKEVTDTYYDLDVDSYNSVGFIYKNLNQFEFFQLQAYQEKSKAQIFFPIPDYYTRLTDANIWYELREDEATKVYKAISQNRFYTELTGDLTVPGEYKPAYIGSKDIYHNNYYSSKIDGDNGTHTYNHYTYKSSGLLCDSTENTYYSYAEYNQSGYLTRILYSEYYKFLNTDWNLKEGITQQDVNNAIDNAKTETEFRAVYDMFEFDLDSGFYAEFWLGTNQYGKDIFTLLASGARLSFILAFSISAINLTIGAIYGAIEGYYGGIADLIMERFAEILSGVPFIVVATLFNLHLADEVGPLVSLLFAFVMTGWLGMAGRVRMQFYRFKGQEYILSSRTLGASDLRIMFKHIFPNAIGTIITGSILSIPGVIFSESSLSYLRIIDLETSGFTSVGTLLSNGSKFVNTFPHILIPPVVFISLLMISFNLFGNGLRDALNPSLRGADE